MPHFRQIALLIDRSTTYSTHIVQGVARFVQEHRPPWQLMIQPRGEHERSLMPRHWQAEGVIARVTHRALARDLARLRIPVVNVSLSVVPGYHFPQVTVDEPLVGTWAAGHLLELGFKQFAYVNIWQQPNYVDRCGPAFRRELACHGLECHRLQPLGSRKSPRLATTTKTLQRWLHRLPRPVGVLAVDAEDAHLLRETCRISGLRIPEDVAIVSGEDDSLLCALLNPSLSSIDLGSERVGYSAAKMLAQLLQGSRPPRKPTFIPPLRVMTRHSTDTLAIEDQLLAQAVRYIREHADQPIRVHDVVQQVPLSRRTLQQRFRDVLGRTMSAEIRRVHLERAKTLLISTDWTTPRIAEASGFNYTEVMNQVFRRELDMTPTEFRRESRANGQ